MRNSNFFHDRRPGKRWRSKWAVAAFALVYFAAAAYAIDPHRMISQYSRDRWGDRSGFPGGSVSAIAQTDDGYLWIGTEKGLIRFDGLNFRAFPQATPESFPIGPVQGLVADAASNLWILLQSTRILRFHDGKFELGRDEAEFGITAIARRSNGRVLFSSLAYGTLTYNGQRFEILASPGGEQSASNAAAIAAGNDELSSRFAWATGVAVHRVAEPNSSVVSMAETADGKLWLGTGDRGLFYMTDGLVTAVGKGAHVRKVTCLLPMENGELWIGTDKGVMQWNGTKLTQTGVPSALRHVPARVMIRDRDSNIWVGTAGGLIRVNGDEVSFDKDSRAEPVTALFEDREGDLWVGRPSSIERLRDSAFVTYSVASAHTESSGPVYVDPQGRIWFAPFDGGLRWLKAEKTGSVSNDRLSQDVVYSIAGSKNELWIGRQRGGLTHLLYGPGSVTTKTYTQADGLAQNSVYAVHESRDGAVWAGTLSAGVSEFRNGHFTTYTTANGLASNTISSIAEGDDGTIWFGTPKGLSGLAKGGWRTFTTATGLPSDDVNCLLQDSSGVLWIGTADGLAFLSAGSIHVPRGSLDWLREPMFGIAEDRGGWLWIATASRILQVKRSSLISDLLPDSDAREYGLDDGLHGTEGVKRHRSVVEDPQGYVWFSTNRGLSVVNPSRATVNPAPALIHMEAVLADGTPLDFREPIRVSTRRQRTTFRFAGLSLARAGRVRYRYRLEGFDKSWSEPTATPEASYANLPAGSYRFRVIASNSDGLWNGSEAAVPFEVAPTLWQTWWFRLALVLCVGLAALAAYRLRMHELTRVLNVRFEERLAERTRIAQDLHDTLLQGVLSASMQLHVAMDQLPDHSPARKTMTRVLEIMSQVVDEGRNTLRGLRSPAKNAHDLKNSFSRIPQELGALEGIDFRVVVEGPSTPLRPAIRDDIYSIGREALVNAFRHSRANKIEMELEYAADHLRVLVRDDGCGIDPQVLRFGRDGHWGMPGMRERAERIGGKLTVWSRSGGGTEVDLRIPGAIAFESRPATAASKWLRRFRRNGDAA